MFGEKKLSILRPAYMRWSSDGWIRIWEQIQLMSFVGIPSWGWLKLFFCWNWPRNDSAESCLVCEPLTPGPVCTLDWLKTHLSQLIFAPRLFEVVINVLTRRSLFSVSITISNMPRRSVKVVSTSAHLTLCWGGAQRRSSLSSFVSVECETQKEHFKHDNQVLFALHRYSFPERKERSAKKKEKKLKQTFSVCCSPRLGLAGVLGAFSEQRQKGENKLNN